MNNISDNDNDNDEYTIKRINKLLLKLNTEMDNLVDLNYIKNMKNIKADFQKICDEIKNKMDKIIETENINQIIHKNIKKKYLSELYDDNGKINIICDDYETENIDNYDGDGPYVRDNYKSVTYKMELVNNYTVYINCRYSILPYDNAEYSIRIWSDLSDEFYYTDIGIHDKFKININNDKTLDKIFKFKKINTLKFFKLFYKNMHQKYPIPN
jgi:hypothetical protein